jgi:hypothetical protein
LPFGTQLKADISNKMVEEQGRRGKWYGCIGYIEKGIERMRKR